jgi:hypothetical protein
MNRSLQETHVSTSKLFRNFKTGCEMRKQLRLRWTTGVTTTAGHVATSLMATDTFTQGLINKAIGISAGVYEVRPVIPRPQRVLDTCRAYFKGGVK